MANGISKTYRWVNAVFFHQDGTTTTIELQPDKPFEAGIIDAEKMFFSQSISNYQKNIVRNKILGHFENILGKIVRFELISPTKDYKHFKIKPEIMSPEQYVPYRPRPIQPNKIIMISKKADSKPIGAPQPPPPPAPPAIDKSNYVELSNIDRLQQGDILPGSDFKLGEPDTYYRELLTVNFNPDSSAYELLQQAKVIGEAGRQAGKAPVDIALEVANLFWKNYSPEMAGEAFQSGVAQTIGNFYKNGGVCRHKAALLQMALQEAGVNSRYVRGILAGGGPHAWVEVDASGNNSFKYLIDLENHVSGSKGNLRFTEQGNLVFLVEENPSHAYLVDIQKINVVWRLISEAKKEVALPSPPAVGKLVAPPPPPGYSGKVNVPMPAAKSTAVAAAGQAAPPPPPPGYRADVKASPPPGLSSSIPQTADLENIPIDLLDAVEPIDLMKKMEPEPAPQPASPPSAPEPAVRPQPAQPETMHVPYVKVGGDRVLLEGQANRWQGRLESGKVIKFGFGETYYEVAMQSDGLTWVTAEIKKGQRSVPHMEILRDKPVNIGPFRLIRTDLGSGKVYLKLIFNPPAGKVAAPPVPVARGALDIAEPAPREASPVPAPVRGFPAARIGLNAGLYALMGLAGFVINKGYEHVVHRESKAWEKALAYLTPVTGVVSATLIAGGKKALRPTGASFLQGLVSFLPIATATSVSASWLGIDPETDAGELSVIGVSSLLAGAAPFATVGGTSAASAGLTLTGLGLSALSGFGVGAALVGGVGIGIGLDHGIGQLIKLVDEDGTGTYSGDIARDPWKAAPLVSWALFANPLWGLAVYGGHKLYEHMTEGREEETVAPDLPQEPLQTEQPEQTTPATRPPLPYYLTPEWTKPVKQEEPAQTDETPSEPAGKENPMTPYYLRDSYKNVGTSR